MSVPQNSLCFQRDDLHQRIALLARLAAKLRLLGHALSMSEWKKYYTSPREDESAPAKPAANRRANIPINRLDRQSAGRPTEAGENPASLTN